MVIDFQKEVLSESSFVLVDFYMDSCLPCRVLDTIWPDLKVYFKDKVKFVKVNVEHNKLVTNNYSIMSVPTLLLFKDGVVVCKLNNIRSKSAIIAEIQPHLLLY